jgi:hypothetical protein
VVLITMTCVRYSTALYTLFLADVSVIAVVAVCSLLLV